MEATLELSEHKQKSGKVVSSGPQCMKTPENLFEGAEDASCREASLLAMQCPSHTTSKLNCSMSGYWLHGTIPKVPWLWVHTGCCGLCLQMGGSVTLPSYRCQACEEDVSWNHLPSFQNTKDGYKWRGVPFHWQDLPPLPKRTRCKTQYRYTLPPSDQWTGRNF